MLKPKIAPHIVSIVKEIQDAGFEAYIVGGAVRDFLLNRPPKDYDLSCSATPEQIRKVFKHRRTLIIGRRFRLVHLFHEREIIEISTFRRRPTETGIAQVKGKGKAHRDTPENMIFRDNEYGSAEEDALRRDFTVNAVFYDPVNDKIVDYTGLGISDIHSKIVRTIGDADLRFEEDPVRILRAIKLVGQYGFTMDDETKASVESSLDLILHVSNSRLTLEFEKILKSPYGDQIMEAFHRYGVLKRFLPFVDAHWDTPQGRYMRDLWRIRNERVRAKEYRDSISLAMALMVLPFAEARFGAKEPGGLWDYFPGIDYELADLLRAVTSPRSPTRRALAASIRTLMMQTRIKDASGSKKVQRHPGYPHARELGIIQNALTWQIPNFEEIWTEAHHHSSDFVPWSGPRRKRRERRPDRTGSFDENATPGNEFDEGGDDEPDYERRGGNAGFDDNQAEQLPSDSNASRDEGLDIGNNEWGHEFRSPI